MNMRFTATRQRLLATLAVATLPAVSAHAQAVLDQSNLMIPTPSGGAVVSSQSLAQSFTVGLSGRLSRIDLQLWKTVGTTGDDVLFRLMETLPDGSPNTLVPPILETLIPLDDIAEDVAIPPLAPIYSVDTTPAALAVSPGDQYAYSLSRTDVGAPPWVLTAMSGLDVYGGGEVYRSGSGPDGPWVIVPGAPSRDLGFETYVAVPEPAALALLGLGSVAPFLRRRR